MIFDSGKVIVNCFVKKFRNELFKNGGKMKKKMLVLIALTAVVVTVSAGPALSIDTEKRANYMVGSLGGYNPTGGLDDGGFESGMNTSVAYGRYLTSHLILEGMVDYFRAKAETTGADQALGNYSRDDQIGTTGLLVTLKGEYSVGSVDLFGGAGVGFYGAFLRSEIESDNLGTLSEKDDSDSTFGAHLSLGGNYNINEVLYVGVEGRYRWTGDVEMKEINGGLPVTYSGDLNGYSVAATFGFRF